MELLLRARVEKDGCRVAVVGTLDLCSAAQLQNYLDDVLHVGGPRMVLDVRGITFMDCTGLEVLLRTYRTVSRQGGWLRLTAVPPRVRRLLELTGTQILATTAGDDLTAP
jgi:anti-anti-sigma factor